MNFLAWLGIIALMLINSLSIAAPASPFVTLAKWEAPTTYENGDPLPPDRLAGYKLYCGSESGFYDEPVNIDPSLLEYNLSDIGFNSDGTKYCSLTTYINTDGIDIESGYSDEVSFEYKNGEFKRRAPGKTKFYLQ